MDALSVLYKPHTLLLHSLDAGSFLPRMNLGNNGSGASAAHENNACFRGVKAG